MFTTINNKQIQKICTLDTIHVHIAQITAHDWNVIHGHNGFFAAKKARCCRELLESSKPKFTLVT